MTEFYKGSVPCVIGQTSYQVIHPKINEPLSFPLVSLSLPPVLGTPIDIYGVTNKTTISFDVVLTSAPSVSGYAINWQVNIPGTDVAEYVNDKRYFSKEEIGNPKLARVHWKNVIAAPDMSPAGLQKNHNHDDRYYTKSQVVPVIDSRIGDIGAVSPVVNSIMLRDAHGRSQVNTPKFNADASNKGYVDTKVAGEASARINADLVLDSKIISISGSYATDADTLYLQNQINTLNTLIVAISGQGFYSGGTVPVGTIITRASSSMLGLDWQPCDGGSLAVSGFGELFGIIGYTFGGSGADFNKPDLRGEFVRGWDDGRGVDPLRTFGSSQSGDNKLHSHGTSVNTAGSHNHSSTMALSGGHSHSITIDSDGAHYHTLPQPLLDESGSSTYGANDLNGASPVTQTNSGGLHTHTATIGSVSNHNHNLVIDPDGGHSHSVTVANEGSESRPRNVAMAFFIKVFTPPMVEPVNITGVQSISGQKTFAESIIVPEIPQAIIFGNPLVIGTKAIGIIGTQMVITMHVSAGIWTPINWLT